MYLSLANAAQLNEAIKTAIKRRRVDPVTMFSSFDTDHDGALTHSELQRLLETMHLGYVLLICVLIIYF